MPGLLSVHSEEGIQQWSDLFGYRKELGHCDKHETKSKGCLPVKKGSLSIKLVEPSEPASPVFLFARKGGGLHHLCFRCESLKVQIPLLEAKEAKFLVPPEPGEAFKNHDIAFFLAKNNLNVELIDTKEKKGWWTRDMMLVNDREHGLCHRKKYRGKP